MPEQFSHPVGSFSTEHRKYLNMKRDVDPALLSRQGKCFMFAHIREGVPHDDVYYYSFTIGSKSLMLFESSFIFAEGPVFVSTIEAPTSFTPGTSLVISNTYRGKPGPEMTMTAGATDIVGGYEVPTPEYWPDVGNNTGFAGKNGTTIVIPPGLSGIVKVENRGGNSNIIRFGLLFAELDLVNYCEC
jgi:hypothetical protein